MAPILLAQFYRPFAHAATPVMPRHDDIEATGLCRNAGFVAGNAAFVAPSLRAGPAAPNGAAHEEIR